MGQFKVSKSEFKTPPEDSWWLDLVWIEKVSGGKFGDNYRWHWKISNIDTQKEWSMCRATSQTSLVATTSNRFGHFLSVLQGGVREGEEGSTESLVMKNYRVKGFIEHNKRIYDGNEVIFCNVSKLVAGVKVGEGIGYKGAHDKIKPQINDYLKSMGLPLLDINADADDNESPSQKAVTQPLTESVSVPKREEMPW